MARLLKRLLLALLLAALTAAPAFAQSAAAAPESPWAFSANLGLFSDYRFRGISQTSTNPAVQGGIDYMHSSGLYAGIWGSNVSWIADSAHSSPSSASMSAADTPRPPPW